MPKDSQVNVHVDRTQKERWDEYLANSHRVSSMSDLVRSAVELFIRTDGGTETLGSSGDTDMGELETRLTGIENTLSGMEESVETVRREVVSRTVESSDLVDVLDALPTQSELDEENEVAPPGYTAKEIADRAGLDTATVELALSEIKDDVPGFRTFTRSGEPQRYRRDVQYRQGDSE